MLLVSFCGVIQAGDLQDLNTVESVDARLLNARRLNSMMEAYMGGRFAASKKEAHLKYDNHDAVSTQEDDWAYEDTVERINAELKNIYSQISWGIDGWRPLDFHMVLNGMVDKDQKVTYLQNFTEKDKINVQALRLYDFLKVINMDLPEGVIKQLKDITGDAQLSGEDKRKSIQAILDEQNKLVEPICVNRKTLAQAFAAGSSAQVLEACKKRLHVATFVPLNIAMQKMITDIQAGEENALCSNHSRAQVQGCIIN